MYIVHYDCYTRSWHEKNLKKIFIFSAKIKTCFLQKLFALRKISITLQDFVRNKIPPPRSLCPLSLYSNLFPWTALESTGGGSKRSFETQGRRGIKWRGEEEERAMTKAMIKDNSRSKIKDYSRGPRGPSTNQSPRKYKMHEARIPRGHPSRDPPPLFLPSFLVIPHPL